MKVLISAVSGQAAPLLSTLWDSSIDNPTDVLLYVSDNPAIQKTAEAIKLVFETKGINVMLHACHDAEDISSVRQELSVLKTTLLNISKEHQLDLTINITLGTKIQSSLMVDIFSDLENLKFYYIGRDNTIQFFNKRYELLDNTRRKLEIDKNSFRLHDYLNAYSCEVIPKANIIDDIENTELQKLISKLNKLSTGQIAYWNYLMFSSQDYLPTLPENTINNNSSAIKNLIQAFRDSSMISQQGDVCVFKSNDYKVFAQGGWYEVFIYNRIQQLARAYNISSLEHSLHTLIDNRKNELDIVFFREGVLYIIEVKAMSFAKSEKNSTAQRQKFKDIANKLNIFSSLGGVQTKCAIAALGDSIDEYCYQYFESMKGLDSIYLRDSNRSFEDWFKGFIGVED